MEVIFIVGSAQALFFSLLVFTKKKSHYSDKILGFWLLILGLELIVPAILFSENYKEYIHLAGSDMGLMLAQLALMYLYAKALVMGQNEFRRKDLRHLIPIFFLYLLTLPYFLKTKEEKIAYYENNMEFEFYYVIVIIIFMVYFSYYFYSTYMILKRHRLTVRKLFSTIENVQLLWIRNILISYAAFFVVSFIASGLFSVLELPMVYSDYVGYVMLVLFVYGVGYFGHRQSIIFQTEGPSSVVEHSKEPREDHSISEEHIVTAEEQNFAESLREHMKKTKPFTEPKLSLYDLASQMSVNTHYLSTVLNKVVGKNFYEFVNDYRISEVKNRIHKKEFETFTILTIALESGFNSKSSFNRIFKNGTGQTPSEFIREVKSA